MASTPARPTPALAVIDDAYATRTAPCRPGALMHVLALSDTRAREENIMLLDGINHIAWISKDAARLGRFYAEVFDADVGPTRTHGTDGNETMTIIRIGPHTALNIFVIEGNTEPERQTPMWGRGRIDHFGLQATSAEAFTTIRQRLIDKAASDGTINDFGAVHSIFFRDPDGLEGEVLIAKAST